MLQQNKKSFNYIISQYIFSIPTFGYTSWLDRRTNKSHNYPKEVRLKSSGIKIPKRDKNQKYLRLKNTEFNVNKDNYSYKSIKYSDYKKKKKKYIHSENGDDDIKFSNSIFTDSINKILEDYSFKDEKNKIFSDNLNTLYLNSTIKKVENLGIKYSFGYQQSGNYLKESASFFYNTTIDIVWELKDAYGKIILKKLISSKSGDFSYDFYEGETLRVSIQDAINKSIYQFINEADRKEVLEKENEVISFNEKINIKNIPSISSVDDLLNATVTVRSGDKNHASGCVISDNGYIITNLHVISNHEDDLEVITNNGEKFSAKLIRSNKLHDLALLKIENQFTSYYSLPVTKSYSIGDDILVVGTPENIELGQSISKGIISGLRKASFANFIQTDASINSGNSGGAMINKYNNNLIGIINSKFFGVGIEGIGFAIPAEIIIESLGLKISK